MVIAAGPAGSSKPSDEHLQSVIERIRRLLAMAGHVRTGHVGKSETERQATENEAAAAMEKAQQLLLKYGLERVNLEASGVAKPEPIGHQDVQITNENWRRDLFRAVAKANFCRTVNRVPYAQYKTWVPATVHLVGKPVNRAATIEIFNWIIAQIEGVEVGKKRNGDPLLRGGLYQESWANKPESVAWREWRFGFFTGITDRLTERLEQLVAREVIETPGAMVLVRDSELALKGYWAPGWVHGSGGIGNQGVSGDGGARAAGYRTGDRVTLHKSSMGGGGARYLGSGR